MKKGTFIISSGLFLLLLFFSSDAKSGAAEGLALWWEILIPSLLPSFTAVGLLRGTGVVGNLSRRLEPLAKRFPGISGAGASVLLVGLTGGYPLGARTLRDAVSEGLLNKEEADRLYSVCDNTGPAFAVGALGIGIFSSAGWGLILWGIHALTALLLAGLLCHGVTDSTAPPAYQSKTFGKALTESVSGAVSALLTIGGYVVFFSALPLEKAVEALSMPPEPTVLLRGMLELSSGIGSMVGMRLTPLSLAIGEFILSFGGICVHLQSLAVTEDVGLDGKKRLKGKLLQGVISSMIAYGVGVLLL